VNVTLRDEGQYNGVGLYAGRQQALRAVLKVGTKSEGAVYAIRTRDAVMRIIVGREAGGARRMWV